MENLVKSKNKKSLSVSSSVSSDGESTSTEATTLLWVLIGEYHPLQYG